MTLNLRTRDYKVSIANPEGEWLDVTSLVKSCVVSDRQLDQSGLIQTTGKLVLATNPRTAFSESLDPKVNRDRFARGNKVKLEIADSTGTLTLHPRGAMRIIKRPARPSRRNPQLDIEIGCVLTLLDYKTAPDDASGVKLGEATTRTQIINRIATKAGLPALVDAIPEWEINYPLFKFNGSYVQQCGELAFAAGYVLWVDNLEQLRAKKIELSPAIAHFSEIVGQTESLYEPLDSPEVPAELVRVVAVTQQAKETKDPEPEVSVSLATRFALFGEGDDAAPVVASITTTSYKDMATEKPIITREIKQPKGVLMPDSYPNNTALIGSTETSFDEYEKDDPGTLLRRSTSTIEQMGVTQPDRFPGNLQRREARREVTTYTYEDETTKAIATVLYEQKGVVRPDNTSNLNNTVLMPSSRSQTTWKKTNKGYQQTSSSRSYKPGAGASSGTTYSNSGNNQPPAPERRSQEFYSEQKQLKGEVRFPAIPGAEFDQTEAEYRLGDGAAINNGQCTYVARLIGTMLHGRDEGIQAATDIKDFWLTSYEPGRIADWLDEESVTSRYLIDGVSFAMSESTCVVAYDGINLGVVTTYTPPATPENPDPEPVATVTPPFVQTDSIALTLEFYGGFRMLSYPADAGQEAIEGFLEFFGGTPTGVFGALEFYGSFTESSGSAAWDALDEAGWDALDEAGWDEI